MSDVHPRSQASPSQRAGPPVFPPLSKFYCGPAQGWSSADVSPSHNDPAWGLPSSTPDLAPSLTPRISPAPTVPSPRHWQHHLGRAYEDLQGWQNPVAQTANISRGQLGYHDLPVESHDAAINPGWDSRPTSSAIDTATWGVNHHRRNVGSEDSSKHLRLPPRPANWDGASSPSDQTTKRRSPSSKYSSQQYSTRASATTIDVPLFLQPQPYDPETAPPMPESPMLNYRNQEAQHQASPRQQYSGHSRNNSYENPSLDINRHGRDAQKPFDPAHQRRDSRGSHGSTSSKRRLHFEQKTTLSNADSQSSSRSHSRNDTSGTFAGRLPSRTNEGATNDRNDPRLDEQRKYGLVSLASDTERPPVNTSRGQWDTIGSLTTSSELQQGYNFQQERRSMTATDTSSNLPTTSTPDSHETSNTSYKGSEIRADTVNHDAESNDSFYWHSGRSSDGEDDDSHQAFKISHRASHRNSTVDRRSDYDSTGTARGHSFATTVTNARHSSKGSCESPISQQKDQPFESQFGRLPTRSSSLSPNPAVSYTASALGLGGPSDWEYFGDYEAEEVDDEDLYAQKPRAELPTDYQRIEAPTVPPPEPPHAKLPQRTLSMRSDKANKEPLESIDQQLQPMEPFEPNHADGTGPGSKWSPSTTTPTTPHGDSSRPITVSSEPMPAEDHRPDLDEVIRAWSKSPYVGRTSSVKSYANGGFRSSEANDNPGEASLASTPGEHVLGIHAFPKDAPPLPKLPDLIDLETMTCSQMESEEKQESNIDPTKQQLLGSSAENDVKGGVDHHETKVAEASSPPPALQLSSDPPPTLLNHPASTIQEQSPLSHSVRDTRPLFIESDTVHPIIERLDGEPALHPISQVMEKPPLAKDAARIGAARNESPLSEFARKRQMFETSIELKSSSSTTIPRKPLRTLKQSPSEHSLSGDRKMIATITSEHSLANRSQPTSSGGSLQSIGNESKFVSRVSSKDALQRPSQENLATRSYDKTGGSAPTSAPMEPSTKLSKSQQEVSKVVTLADTTKILEKTQTMNLHVPQLPSPKHSEDVSIPAEQSNKLLKPSEGVSTVVTPPDNLKSLEEIRTKDSQPARLASLKQSTDSLKQIQVSVAPLTDPSSASVDEGIDDLANSAVPTAGSNRNEDALVVEMENSHDDVPPAVATNKASEESHQAVVASDLSSNTEDAADPYADLDPWGRASLNRFAAMLREEARVESNKDKLNIFNVFTARETRLRVVLYGTEEDLLVSSKSIKSPKPAFQRVTSQKIHHLAKASSVKIFGSKMGIQKRQGATKELPPLPPDRDSIVGPPTSKYLPIEAEGNQSRASDESALLMEVPRYSPGGRPIVQQPTLISAEDLQLPDNLLLEDTNCKAKEGLYSTEPISVPGESTPKTRSEDATTTKPVAYARPRFNEGGELRNYLENRRSIYRPFATQTAESMENASNFGRDIELSVVPPPVPPLPLNPQISTSPSEDNTGLPEESSNPDKEPSLDLRRFDESDFDALIIVLPSPDVHYDTAERLIDLKAILDGIPDDFGFIHAGVVAWDNKVKSQREANERARHARQIESEQRIDALFDDHEIGYGDIAELEGDFKRSEVTQKAEEDRWEYETFVGDVFALVWARLTYEIDQLRPHYEKCSSLMHETVAGKDMFTSGDCLALAPTMSTFLGLHQKLEIRYQKAFEAILERDRRLKKVEMSPWHGLSNLEKLKRLDKQFEDTEKQAIIDYCQQRDERANRLMDVLDQNTLRGVGANQDYMEAIMKGVRRIAGGRAFASLPISGGMSQGIKLVERAQATVASLASSSEQIVQTFHVADMLLNNADYEVSVAKAKIARDMTTLTRLKEERAKEDQKLMRDLEHRLALIREDHRRTHDEIIKLMLFLGVHGGSEGAALAALGTQRRRPLEVMPHSDVTVGAEADPDHEGRMQRALEEAKRRNGNEMKTQTPQTTNAGC